MANAAMEQGTAEDLGGGEEGGGEFGAGAVNRFIDSSIRMKSQRGRHDPQQRNTVKSLHSNGLRVSRQKLASVLGQKFCTIAEPDCGARWPETAK